MADPHELVALGAFAGAQVLVVCLSAVIANAYRERALLFHGAAVVASVITLQLLFGGHTFLAEAGLLLVLSLSGMQLRELVNHAGALRMPRRWLVTVSAVVLPLLALVTFFGQEHLLLVGLAAWTGGLVVPVLRAWPQSQPWAWWLVPGLLALAVGAAWFGWQAGDSEPDQVLPVAALLTAWSSAVYLASVWRSRVFSETRVRLDARNTVDPLTGLSTLLVMNERVSAARNLIKRYGHPSVLLLVHLENLPRLAHEYGPEVAESALLVAANRIRQAIGDGGIAARLSHSRIAVLAEGASLAEATANVASRILVAGLKDPLPMAPGEFLQFRIVLAAVPVAEISGKAVLHRMGARMDEQLIEPSERRIHTLTPDEITG